MSEPRPPKRKGGTRAHSHPVQAWSPPPTTGPPNVCVLLDENLSRWWDFKSKRGALCFHPTFSGSGDDEACVCKWEEERKGKKCPRCLFSSV